ncbi:hypothetical protein SAMN02745166_01096 [Prosthecobacter debontii]|uniref:Uncharacterized protein n=1 Tax=Prosthecobacter debontii TaxID=48467 RepID=A0A1T4X625_9BACT|nr:hypothetical protein SAMN02745166_01096 [Prosthecobacter debontii]
MELSIGDGDIDPNTARKNPKLMDYSARIGLVKSGNDLFDEGLPDIPVA